MRVPFAVVALCLAPTLAASQSLGDTARRQARKRASDAPAAKTYTNDDLDAEGGEPGATQAAPPVVAEPAAADPAPVLPKQTADDAVRAQLDREAERRKEQETYWRQQSRAVLARVASAQREYDEICGPGKVLTGG